MGHGDTIIVSDENFPPASMGKNGGSEILAKAGLKVFHAGAIGENDGQFLAYETRKILPPEMLF